MASSRSTSARNRGSVSTPAGGTDDGRGSEQAASSTPDLSPRETRRQHRIETSRQQILDAAEHLFGTLGYQGTSLEQVARDSEFSVGALYSFFEGKQALLEAVTKRRDTEVLARMRSRAESDERGTVQLAGLVGVVVGYFHAHPDFARLSTRLYQTGALIVSDTQVVEGFEMTLELYAAAIARGQAEGDFRAGNPSTLARLVASLVSAHRDVDPDVAGTRPGISEAELQEIIQHALATSKPKPPPKSGARASRSSSVRAARSRAKA